ncbi:MBL fold metallo-hydrolase [Chloroflexota bacterium]
MILKILVVGPYASNCYIVGSEISKQGMIIDPGAEAERILRSIQELGLEIRLIVLTHGHSDHIDGLKKVGEATGAELAVHADDARYLKQQPSLSMPGSSDQDTLPDRLLSGGDSIDLGDTHFSVLHTPGHSLGSICLLGHGLLFSGDTLFNYGIGRYDLPGGSYDQLMDSLHGKLMILPDDTVVYPGHGPDTTIGAERRGNPFLRGQF